jgi:hypothetical protein
MILYLVKKRGPLARKRELRAMLERQDEGYEDDAFDGTPFKNRKPLLKVLYSNSFLKKIHNFFPVFINSRNIEIQRSDS